MNDELFGELLGSVREGGAIIRGVTEPSRRTRIKEPDVSAVRERPNHARYIRTLRRMSPEERLAKAFELSEYSNALFLHGLRRRFPDLGPEEFSRLVASRLEKCHNRSF